MTRFRVVVATAAAVALFGAATVRAQAQDEGVKAVEQLVKKARETVEAIANTKAQLGKTMEVYNTLMADTATDRKGLYKKLQQQMASTEERRAEIKVRADEASASAEGVFKSWADSAAAISDPALRKRSEDRITSTRASLAQVKAAGQKASDLYAPVMKTLQDQVTYLGHDLNASAITSLKPDAAKLNARVEELTKQLDDTISSANAAISAISPK
ncbi:MAG TPA: DUF2959 family protein [Vicinamibacteria bacterium]|nr:DUF2959 family protein [Vicinamibacteria bacterium]